MSQSNSDWPGSRESELMTLVCLGKMGLSSPLYGRFNNGICYGFVEGKPFTPDDMKAPEKFKLVRKKLHTFRSIDPMMLICLARLRTSSLCSMPWMYTVSVSPLCSTHFASGWRRFLRHLMTRRRTGERVNLVCVVWLTYKVTLLRRFKEQFSMERCVEELEFLEEQLSGSTSDIVFCHNDLLCANILYQAPDQDGRTGAKVRFIDYEYGNYNWRAYVAYFPYTGPSVSHVSCASAVMISPTTSVR